MKITKLYILALVGIFFTSCTKKNKNYSDVPEIFFSHLSDSVIRFADTNSFIHVNFSLVDGDKDFGIDVVDTAIKIDEYRSDTLYRSYTLGMPAIPRDYLINDYLEAQVLFTIPGVGFTPRLDQIHRQSRKDTFYLKFWVTDAAGNKSNVEQTPKIYIQEN